MKHLFKIYTTIIVFTILSILYLYLSLNTTEKNLTINLNSLFIAQSKNFALNIDHYIHKSIKKDLLQTLQDSKGLREKLENSISLLSTPSYKYVYILYKDTNGNYRYLLDGSIEDRGEFKERLNVDKIAWDSAYNTKKDQLIYQNKFDNLWITYLKPIIYNNKTQAVLAMDFSPKIPISISKTIHPLSKLFLYLFIAIFIMFIILLYQLHLNFKTKKESITDPLTQAYNRNYLRELLKKINISKYQILMLDIDYFKKVNDTYGHAIGDNVLRDIATIIKHQIREKDIFIRFGGEEFLIFIEKNSHQPNIADTIAQRVRKTIEERFFKYDDICIKITISIGITSAPEKFKTISDAIKHTDEMLYIAKREGRNQVIYHIDDNYEQQNTDPTQLHINDIKEAIEEDRILCYFQAIVNGTTDEISKYEALVRIQSKDGTIIPPICFLANIFHTSLYVQLTKVILEKVFSTIASNQKQISVNLNFSDIIDNSIFQLIIEELEKNKESAQWLIIELLEYEPLEKSEKFINNLLKIKSYGVKIAIDDFGTGFANYNIFNTLPIDIIKIDGSLIKNIDTSLSSKTIVNSIIMLTKELNIESVAEFVHSKEVYMILKELKVDNMQGFYLAKPQSELLLHI